MDEVEFKYTPAIYQCYARNAHSERYWCPDTLGGWVHWVELMLWARDDMREFGTERDPYVVAGDRVLFHRREELLSDLIYSGYEVYRVEDNPPRSAWWWWLDEVVAGTYTIEHLPKHLRTEGVGNRHAQARERGDNIESWIQLWGEYADDAGKVCRWHPKRPLVIEPELILFVRDELPADALKHDAVQDSDRRILRREFLAYFEMAYAAFRERERPSRSAWWWWLDEIAAGTYAEALPDYLSG